MGETRRADDDRIPVLALHQAVMRHPPESNLRHSQAMLLRDDLNGRQCTEVRVVPVPVAVVLWGG